ncbi:large ribosomal subunit protein uL11m-like [Antedon mediterranea]|uniref:large ribosomal subunit protein uL11m-like n=1 Tax=Antedon mediterranea TaxID=105859 RepID=UPI003AF7DB81
MSRVGKAVKDTGKVVHGNVIKTYIKAGRAAPGPPLGPVLGQRGIPIGQFCKDFNQKTNHIKEGIPLPTNIIINPDRTCTLEIKSPPVSYFVKSAAGVAKGAHKPGNHCVGQITLKHVYEIAKVKQEDPNLQIQSMERICKGIIGSCLSMGIQVVRELNPDVYKEFLEKSAEEANEIREEVIAEKAGGYK